MLIAGATRQSIVDALHCRTNTISRIRQQLIAEGLLVDRKPKQTKPTHEDKPLHAVPAEQNPQDAWLEQIGEIADGAYRTLRQVESAADITDPKWVQSYSQLVCAALKAAKMRQELTPEVPRQVIELVVGDLPPEEGDGWRLESETPDYDPNA